MCSNFNANMTKINNMRAKLLFEAFYQNEKQSQVTMTFSGLVGKVLTVPSYFHTECCTKRIQNFPIVYLHDENLNLTNMNQAIENSFGTIMTCGSCKKNPLFKRDFASHIFIEVMTVIPFYLIFILYKIHHHRTFYIQSWTQLRARFTSFFFSNETI